MLKRLSKYGVANKLFVEYYKQASWQFPIALSDLLSDKYVRHQASAFTDFIASMNIGMLITPVGFTLYVIRPDLMDEYTLAAKDIIFVPTETGWYNIANVDVRPPDGLIESGKTDALLAYVRNEAIVYAMEHINTITNLYKQN